MANRPYVVKKYARFAALGGRYSQTAVRRASSADDNNCATDRDRTAGLAAAPAVGANTCDAGLVGLTVPPTSTLTWVQRYASTGFAVEEGE
jgi:hypothetical protein